MANKFGVKFKSKRGGSIGFAAVMKTLKKVEDQGKRAHKAAVNAVTKLVFEKSQYYCPVDTELLKDTAYWYGEKGTTTYRGKSMPDYITYIIYPQPYAVFVHECVDHYHEPPTQAKFISQAVADSRSEMNEVAGAAFKDVFFTEYSSIE